MLVVRLQSLSGLPIYRQIVRQVRASIATGRLVSGDPIPSVRELSQQLGVNPMTIAKAYGELERSGVVTTRRGTGTFVAANPPDDDLAARRDRLSEAAELLAVEAYHLGFDLDATQAAVESTFARFARERAGGGKRR